MRDSHDVFLVLNDFRARASQHRAALNPLSIAVESHLIGAEGYLDPEDDTGLIVLRFSTTSKRVLGCDAIHAMVAESGLPMIVPSALGPAARRTFYMRHLSHYSVYLQQYPANDETYGLLARTLMGLAAHIAESAPSEEFASPLASSTTQESASGPANEDLDSLFSFPFDSTLDVDEQDILNELPVIIDLPRRRSRRAQTVL